jgi:NAD-dependent DNA ligase
MGYTTEFSGELLFTEELKASELAELNKFLGEDCREHPEWENTSLTYIDLELTKNFDGLTWNGSEKTYDLTEKVNLVIERMQKVYPGFGLTGELLAQGEEVGDVWRLVMKNNVAYEVRIDLSHKKKVTCPHCDEEFFLEEEKSSDDELLFVFTGFRNEDLSEQITNAGHNVSDKVSKNTTHLIMKDTSKTSSKKEKAEEYDCKIWSIEQLEDFLNL